METLSRAQDPSGYGPRRRAVNACALLSLLTLCAGPARAAEPVAILALGDSLTAGYGLAPEDSFPARLEAALAAKGIAAKVENGGVSGDTSAGGLARLDWATADHPSVALVELGANDMLRGTDPAATEANLDQILTRLQARGIRILLCGMHAASNWGPDYQRQFDAIYPALAARHGVALYPFFLDGVALDPKLVQADGLHPNPDGVKVIVQRILPAVAALVAAAPAPAP